MGGGEEGDSFGWRWERVLVLKVSLPSRLGLRPISGRNWRRMSAAWDILPEGGRGTALW